LQNACPNATDNPRVDASKSAQVFQPQKGTRIRKKEMSEVKAAAKCRPQSISRN
jgi:hypothetical protein